MELLKPSINYLTSFRKYVKEYELEQDFFYLDLYSDSLGNFKNYLRLLDLHSMGKRLPRGLTSYNTYWLIDYHEVVGVVRIRKKPMKVIGNIGYDIRPSFRGEGYGTKLLNLAKNKAKEELNMNKLYVSCYEGNIASKKIIEKNGGKFYKIEKGSNGDTFLMYIIDL